MKNKKRTRGAALFLALILLSGALFAAPAARACGEGSRYIVKIKESSDLIRADGKYPFDVVSEAEMIRLRDAGLLEWYEPDGVMELLDEPIVSPFPSDKWDLYMIRADASFDENAVGQGVRVGVVDSGISPHPALNDRLLPGGNYMEGADATDTSDRYGHGTQVAGLIAGKDENGALGAAPGAYLVPLKVTNGKSISTAAVCRAIYGGIDDFGCSVLNLSLGIRTDSEALREAVEYAERQGVVIVSAVGNNGNASRYFPACYETAIGVGAVDETGAVYYRSNQNDSVFLTAPGANVKTAGRPGGYTNVNGTSFAVPYVTAAAAVLRGVDPALTPGDVRDLLAVSATDKGAVGWDKTFGWGVVNIGDSVTALIEKAQDPGDDPNDEPCPRDGTCPMAVFSDLDVNGWYHDGVHWALGEGIMVGTGAKTFSPDMAATRAMLVTMLWRAEGSPEPANEGKTFSDVRTGEWYEKAVLWAASEGITAGTGATEFSPNAELTREQLATFMFRYAGYKGDDVSVGADLSGYTDADGVSDYAKSAVGWAVSVGVVEGTADANLEPQKSASRAEVAVMLMRFRTLSAG